MFLVWLKFVICAGVIFLAGSRLTKYGDVIAEKTGMCRAWIGLVLLASITSLPELSNGISAAAIAKVPDLAVGDLLGACMVNMFTLALLDMFQWSRGRKSIFINPKESNVLSALFGLCLLLIVAFSLAVSRYFFDFVIFGISIYSLIIFVTYLFAQKLLYALSGGEGEGGEESYSNISNVQAYSYFLLSAVFVIAAGSWLPFIGNEIVSVMGWGKTFVAVLFLGLATTLPEMTVSIFALRLGAVGMAIGNLIGSNIFNLAIVFIVDIFYRPGALLSAVTINMVYAALSGALLIGIVYFALKKQISNHIPSLIIILLYVFSLLFLFQAGLLS
jgi:cation:H+ antiporter